MAKKHKTVEVILRGTIEDGQLDKIILFLPNTIKNGKCTMVSVKPGCPNTSKRVPYNVYKKTLPKTKLQCFSDADLAFIKAKASLLTFKTETCVIVERKKFKPCEVVFNDDGYEFAEVVHRS